VLLASLEMLQKFDPAKSEKVHATTESAEMRNLVGSMVPGSQQATLVSSKNILLSEDESLLFYIQDGRRKLVTYEAKNKSERDVVFDKVVDLDGGQRDRGRCAGAVLWGNAGSGATIYLLSWFQDSKACLQCIGCGGKSIKGENNFCVTREIEVERDLQWEEESTPWVVLTDFLLARSFRHEGSLCLELIRVIEESGSVRFKPETYSFGKSEGGKGQGKRVSAERIVRNCLGHTFLHALGHRDGTIDILPWPVIGDSQGNWCLPSHRGPISCLEEWDVVVGNHQGGRTKILLSACERGEIKAWNLESLECMSTLSVGESHISALLLPERHPSLPWSECFAAVGKDGVMSFVSIKEMTKVRAFLAYPDTNELVSIAWNYKRNYVACLSILISDVQGESSHQFLCTITDVLSCRTERYVVGSGALQSFSEFLGVNEKYIALCNKRRACKSLKYSYSSIEKSHQMSIVSSDLHLLLEASAQQPELQLILCTVMLAMQLYEVDDTMNLEFQRGITQTIAAINQNESKGHWQEGTNLLQLLPALVGPDNATYTIWLCHQLEGRGSKPALPAQLMAHMNLVVLSGLGWANSKSFLSPEQFSSLNTFYGIRVPERISGAPLDAMHTFVEHIEHTNEHARDASNVLLHSTLASMEDKPSAMQSIQKLLSSNGRGSRDWAKNILILGLIAVSFEDSYDHTLLISELLSTVGEPSVPFHSSLVSLLTKGMSNSTRGWKDTVEKSFSKVLTSIFNAIHAVNDHVPPDLSPRKLGKVSPFTTLLSRDKLMQLLTLMMQQNIRKFMNIFIQKLQKGEVNSASSILPMIFTSILSLINAHPWSLFGATHQVMSACFTCMDPSNPLMRKSYLHIGMTIVCEMGQKLPFIDMNASSMLICIPAAPVEKNASRYIHVFNAKSAEMIQELQFEDQKHLTPLAVKISPDSGLLACFSVEDSCIRVWSIKQSWTSAFRMSPRVNLPSKRIPCHFTLQTESDEIKNMQGYALKWASSSELHLLHNNIQLGRVSAG